MNLQKIFDDTDFVHTSGTKEELQVAEYLKAQCETLGAKTHMEAFRVPMGDIEEAHLYADGEEIACRPVSAAAAEAWKASCIICRERIRYQLPEQRIRSSYWIWRA